MGRMLLQAKTRNEEEIEFDAEKEFAIGNDLDWENKNQAILITKVSKIYGSKYFRYKKKELELLILKDELAEDIRQNPKRWNIHLKEGSIVSEAMIDRVIVRNEKYRKCYLDWIKTKSEAKEWEGVLEAARQRGHSLGRLSRLDD